MDCDARIIKERPVLVGGKPEDAAADLAPGKNHQVGIPAQDVPDETIGLLLTIRLSEQVSDRGFGQTQRVDERALARIGNAARVTEDDGYVFVLRQVFLEVAAEA